TRLTPNCERPRYSLFYRQTQTPVAAPKRPANIFACWRAFFARHAVMRNGAPSESILHNVDKVQIGCHLDLLLVLLRWQFLPFGLRKDQLPLSVSCDAYRHGKLRLVGQPAIGNGVFSFVTLQLQSWNVLMPQVLIENRG